MFDSVICFLFLTRFVKVAKLSVDCVTFDQGLSLIEIIIYIINIIQIYSSINVNL